MNVSITDEQKLQHAAAYASAAAALDFDAIAELSEPGLVVWHNFDEVEVDAAGAARALRWLHGKVPDLVARDVAVLPTPQGYVRQALLTGTGPGGPLRLHSCTVVTLSPAGKVARIEEYLDTAAMAPLS